jgi:hypothetical protein
VSTSGSLVHAATSSRHGAAATDLADELMSRR